MDHRFRERFPSQKLGARSGMECGDPGGSSHKEHKNTKGTVGPPFYVFVLFVANSLWVAALLPRATVSGSQTACEARRANSRRDSLHHSSDCLQSSREAWPAC